MEQKGVHWEIMDLEVKRELEGHHRRLSQAGCHKNAKYIDSQARISLAAIVAIVF